MKDIKILIVEDELLIAENLAMKLENLNYNVVGIVSSGKAAIKKVNTLNPDLILMDIAIKGNMDGIQTTEAIRANHDIPVIYLTAYADDATLERASKTGCYGYIIKPFKDRELHAKVKMALSKHQEQAAIYNSLKTTISEYAAKNRNTVIDSLTQIPNHLFLRDIFDLFVAKYENYSSENSADNHKLLAIACFSIDRFERVQKFFGEDNKNLLLKKLVDKINKLTDSFYNSNNSAIVRLQDDEFAIFLSGIDTKKAATDFATLILQELKDSFIIDSHEIFLSVSIGISFYDSEKPCLDLLLKQAQKAMTYAQRQGGNQYKLHTLSLDTIVSDRAKDISLETDLHYALKRQELEIYYEPKVSLNTGKIVGVEALLRWNHPQLGLIYPDKVISVASATGLIKPIEEWVLKTACKQTKIWHKSGFDFLNIAVNISGHQFKQSDLFHRLTQILSDSALEAKFLELELTEQTLVDNIKTNIQKLNLIKKLGIKISLDDFGTGYSSLGYLQQFPFDHLKIDRCFIKNIDQNPKNAVITTTIIEMAHQLDLKVIAEGIETKAELEFLQQHQCDEVQGYFISRSLSAKEFSLLLAQKDIAKKFQSLTVSS